MGCLPCYMTVTVSVCRKKGKIHGNKIIFDNKWTGLSDDIVENVASHFLF